MSTSSLKCMTVENFLLIEGEKCKYLFATSGATARMCWVQGQLGSDQCKNVMESCLSVLEVLSFGVNVV